MLQALLERPGAILSRAQLETGSTAGARLENNAISVYMHQLRKLGDDLLHTVRGLGYAGPAKDGGA